MICSRSVWDYGGSRFVSRGQKGQVVAGTPPPPKKIKPLDNASQSKSSAIFTFSPKKVKRQNERIKRGPLKVDLAYPSPAAGCKEGDMLMGERKILLLNCIVRLNELQAFLLRPLR